jgi:hypothetical protein
MDGSDLEVSGRFVTPPLIGNVVPVFTVLKNPEHLDTPVKVPEHIMKELTRARDDKPIETTKKEE